MDTLSFTTRSEHYGKTVAARADIHAVGEKTFYLEKGTRVVLLSLVYILNGNHEPKKVQGLNLVLLVIFFMVGFIFNQDLLPFGFAFSGIALLNGVNMLVVQNFSGKVRNPLEREIVRHIHYSLQQRSKI
ncbi:MAG: hypothetical protein WBW71_11990 [Bacteroidota bacterium]